MKLLIAIVISIGLLGIAYLVTGVTLIDFDWILVLLTSFWAAVDSKRIRLYQYDLWISCRPISLFCCCSLLWVFVFPWYLWARFKIIADEVPLKDEMSDDIGPFRRSYRKFSQKTKPIVELLLFVAVLAKMALTLFFIYESRHAPKVWADYKHQLEAKGETIDWNAMIPPTVPDSQNFFEAPMMTELFVKPTGGINIGGDLQSIMTYTNYTPRVPIANIIIGPDLNPSSGDIVLHFNDFQSHLKAIQLFKNVAGTGILSAINNSILTAEPAQFFQIKPLHIYLVASNTLNTDQLRAFFTGISTTEESVIFASSGSNSYSALASFCSAKGYLEWSSQFDADFNLMRDAVKRPYARIDGDYANPVTIPSPNFISFRLVSETLAQRAQCYLLLGQPDKALQELTLLNDLRRVLEFKPSNKPMTLVAAMINVAVLGVYTRIINDGFQLNEWKDSQLIALQTQLEQINDAPFLKEALHVEEVGPPKVFNLSMRRYLQINENASFVDRVRYAHYQIFMPGFYYSSILNVVKMDDPIGDSIDSSHDIIWPKKADAWHETVDKLTSNVHFWHYDMLLATIAIPNFSRAIMTFAVNQNMANEAQVACALERHHLSHGKYPDTLNGLVPEFISQLPNDVIDGGQLKYHPISNDRFSLYSIGWNETNADDQYTVSVNGGDWNWKQ